MILLKDRLGCGPRASLGSFSSDKLPDAGEPVSTQQGMWCFERMCILSGIKCQDLDLSKQCWEGDGGTFQRWGLVGCDFIHEDSALERDWCGFPVRRGVFLKTKPWGVPGFLTSQSSPLTVTSAKNLSTMSEYSCENTHPS